MKPKVGQTIFIGPDKERAEANAATLEQAGLSVEATAVPTDCLNRITAEVNCVVSTYRLNGTNGVALLRDIREEYPDLPFILVVMDGDETVASEAIEANVTDYIAINDSVPSDLAENVKSAIKTYRTRKRRQQEIREVHKRISDAFFAVDEEFQFTYVNEHAEQLLQADAETLLGTCLWENYPEARETEAYDAFYDAHETQQPTTFELYYDHLDIWLNARIYPSTTGLSVYFRDVTERRKREQTLRDASEIMADPARSFDTQIEALLEVVRETVGTDYATLSYIHDDEYIFEAVAAPADADLQPGETVPLKELPNCEHVVETEQMLVLRDVEAEAPELADPQWGIASYLGAPVTVNNEIFGTFCFYDMETRSEAFSDWAVSFVEFLSNWVSREIEREQYTDQLNALDTAFPDVGFLLDMEGRYLECLTSPATSDLFYAEPEELLGQTFHEVLPADTADSLLVTIRNATETGQLQTIEYQLSVPAGMRWFEARVTPLRDGEYGCDTVVFIARDITDRKVRKQALERQCDELMELQRLNTLVREITQALQNKVTRDAIEAAVCNHLIESDLYKAAWIGTSRQHTTGGVAVNPQTAAGVDEAYLDSIPEKEGPAQVALQSSEIQVIDDIATADAFPNTRRDIALAHDYHSLAAIPLTTGETTYGLLVVYPPAHQTIDESERNVLVDLGQMIALAIQRVNSQRSLTAETTVELQLQIQNTPIGFEKVTAQLDCELIFDRQIPVSDGMSLQYFTVHGAEPTQLCGLLMDAPLVDTCTVIRDIDDDIDRQALIEVSLNNASESAIDVLIDQGAAVTMARAVDGDIHITAEVAPESDVRAIMESIREVTSTVELVSKRLVDRPMTTVPAIKDQVSNQLTTKQEAVLSAAYTRGYYSWPRESTAEELAETMDIGSSTLHYHLRHAVQNLLTTFFEQDCD